LANSVTIPDSDFQGLASARAKAVREYLIQNGKVEPERVFLAEPPAEGVKSQGSRAYLQFR
jgi:flagellar motor protein MotB